MRKHIYICITFLKFIFSPPHSQSGHYAFYPTFFSIKDIPIKPQKPDALLTYHNTNEPLLHNNTHTAATGYNIERTHGHNSGTL